MTRKGREGHRGNEGKDGEVRTAREGWRVKEIFPHKELKKLGQRGTRSS